ncbi:SIMPL domain-containing protein [Hippea sp. KM1]|uniref:SIMPL domain-containing protein n=1 Tax=Hippea sp. KM1 TaxID=944481 RepID=UPI00046CCEE4|nr:SIMPL domain-containing protein [Hippea sp. KM1]
MRRVVWIVLLVFAFGINAFAAERYSVISTNFKISKSVECDRLIAGFSVWAEADNYAMALGRLKPINKDFMRFLSSLLPKSDIKTNNSYSYSKRATVVIKIDTSKMSVLSKILNYLSEKNFPYKTGIEVDYVSYAVSYNKQARLKQEIFKEALLKAKELLKTINSIMNQKYYLGNLSVNYNFGSPVMLARSFMKAPAKNGDFSGGGFNTSSGKRVIKVNVRFEAISPLK